MFTRILFFLSTLTYACFSGSTLAATNNLSQGQTGLIKFNSVNPTGYINLVKKRFDTTPVEIQGTLSFPPGIIGTTTKIPAMVIAHGSSGLIRGHFSIWAKDINKMGIAAFILDSHATRGGPGSRVPRAARTADGLKALQLLSTHPNIDTNRIGIVGYSQGGSMAHNTAFEEIRTTIINDDLKFAAHIMFYAICDFREVSSNMTGKPMLFLHGELDEYDDVKNCEALSDLIRANGVDVSMTIYPGAHHAFDFEGTVVFDPNAARIPRACHGQTNLETLARSRFDTGQEFASGSEWNNYIASCQVTGASSGGNPFARAQSREDVKTFLGRVFNLPGILPSSQPDRIFNWAEGIFPGLFSPSRPASKYVAGYYFRYYSNTNSYLAIKDGRVFYYAPNDSTAISDIGPEADFLPQAKAAGF